MNFIECELCFWANCKRSKFSGHGELRSCMSLDRRGQGRRRPTERKEKEVVVKLAAEEGRDQQRARREVSGAEHGGRWPGRRAAVGI